MKIVTFPSDFYDDGVVKFSAGQYYALNSETQSLVNTGYAELLDEDSVDHVEFLQAKASIAHERADAAMVQALALAEEAQACQALADAAAVPPAA